MTPDKLQNLREFLDDAVAAFDGVEERENDPISIAWRYAHDDDRELVAFISAALAYGRVDLLKAAIDRVVLPWGDRPAQKIMNATFDEISDAVGDFQYRMTFRDDVVDLLVALSRVLNDFGSLYAAYVTDGDHLASASHLIQTIRERRERSELARGLRYLLVDPTDGSTAKRLHLFFRWVVRGPDDVDFGLWPVEKHTLIAPIDTHTARMWRYVGLTDRRTVDLKFAQIVTEGLREIRPDDPLVYDFPICHLGISQRCIHKRSDDHCPGCPIEAICSLS